MKLDVSAAVEVLRDRSRRCRSLGEAKPKRHTRQSRALLDLADALDRAIVLLEAAPQLLAVVRAAEQYMACRAAPGYVQDRDLWARRTELRNVLAALPPEVRAMVEEAT